MSLTAPFRTHEVMASTGRSTTSFPPLGKLGSLSRRPVGALFTWKPRRPRMSAFQRADTALVDAMVPIMGLILFPKAMGAADAATGADDGCGDGCGGLNAQAVCSPGMWWVCARFAGLSSEWALAIRDWRRLVTALSVGSCRAGHANLTAPMLRDSPLVEALSLSSSVQLIGITASDVATAWAARLKELCLWRTDQFTAVDLRLLVRAPQLKRLATHMCPGYPAASSSFDASVAAEIAAWCSKLEALELSHPADDFGADALRLIVDGCPRLARVKLGDCRGLQDVSCLTQCTHLCHIDVEEAYSLYQAETPQLISLSPLLEVLRCAAQTLGAAGLASLTRCCSRLTRLELNLEDRVGRSFLVSIALLSMAPAMKSLVHLALKGNVRHANEPPEDHEIGDDVLRAVAAGCRGLKTLQLEGAAITDAGLSELAACQPALTSLSLSACQDISPKGVEEVLSACATINDLDLSWDSHLTTVTALRLFGGAQASITKLNLCGTEIDDSGVETLARLFSKLEHLNLSYCNDMTDAAIKSLMRHGAPCLSRVGLDETDQITWDVCASTSFELRNNDRTFEITAYRVN